MKSEHDQELHVWEVMHRRQVVNAAPWLQLWVETVRLPDGRLINDYYTLEQADFVAIFALAEAHRVLGIWHYKHGPRRVNLGLPAGYVMLGESPLLAARRELREETGYQADSWQLLGSFTVDGNRGCGQAHIYLARGLHVVADPDPDDLEEIRLELLSLHDLRLYLQAGKVATLGAAAAIALGLNTLTHLLEG
jgi:ADP-ribose pyrophosphatase